MLQTIELTSIDIATVSAIIAALVTVISNAFNIKTKYRAIVAMVLGVVFVFLPKEITEKTLTALIIGLTASGVYSQVKPRELFNNMGPVRRVVNSKKSNSDQGTNQPNKNEAMLEDSKGIKDKWSDMV